MSKLVELRNKLAAKQKHLAKAWDLAGDDRDFTRPDFLEHLGATDAADAVAKIRELDQELTDIFDEVRPLAEMESIQQRTDHIGLALADLTREVAPLTRVVAVARRDVGYLALADANRAVADRLQPGDQSQQSRLAAAGGTDHDQ